MKPSLNRPFLFWFCWSENWRVSNGWGNEEDGAPGRLRKLLRSMSPVERTLDQHSTRAECKRTDSLDFRMRRTDQREKACKRGDGRAGFPSALQNELRVTVRLVLASSSFPSNPVSSSTFKHLQTMLFLSSLAALLASLSLASGQPFLSSRSRSRRLALGLRAAGPPPKRPGAHSLHTPCL